MSERRNFPPPVDWGFLVVLALGAVMLLAVYYVSTRDAHQPPPARTEEAK